MAVDSTLPADPAGEFTRDPEIGPLIASIEQGRGDFTLIFVWYQRETQLNWLLARLREAMPSWRLTELSLVDGRLPVDGEPSRFFDKLRELAAPAGGDAAEAVLLTHWDKLIDFDHPDARQPPSALVGVFNLGRSQLRESLPCPVVVFVTERAMRTLLRLAPDFVSWQSATYDFDDDREVRWSELKDALRGSARRADDAALACWLAALLESLDGAEAKRASHQEKAGRVPLLAEARQRLGNLYLGLANKAAATDQFRQLRALGEKHQKPQWRKAANEGLRQAAKLSEEPKVVDWKKFRGASSFKENDPLFGREDVLERLYLKLTAADYRCGTLWGETGCGKTSLVRARNGIMSMLRRGGFLAVYVNSYRGRPESELTSALARAVGIEGATSLEEAAIAAQARHQATYVICDQFEQVFTGMNLRSRDARKPFFERIRDCALNASLRLRFLFLLRADQLFHLTEFDELAPAFRQLDRENYHELLWLSEPETLRVFKGLRDESGAPWEDRLLAEVSKDMAAGVEFVRPVEIQMMAVVLYKRGITTPFLYDKALRKDGLLTDYLNVIFDTMDRPAAARKAVRSLVDTSNPNARPWRTAAQIASEVHVRERTVKAILDELVDVSHAVQRPEPWDRELAEPMHYQLVHDILIQPARDAATPNQIGLGVIRAALLKSRRFLGPRELWAVSRSDRRELLSEQQAPAWQLIRNSLALNAIVGAILLVVLSCAGLLAVQNYFAHVRASGRPPYNLMVFSGERRLDFLSGPFGDRPLLDTGLPITALSSPQRISDAQAMPVTILDYQSKEFARKLLDNLDPASAGFYRCYAGDWSDGLRGVLDWATKGPVTPQSISEKIFHPRFVNAVERLSRVDPAAVSSVMLGWLSRSEQMKYRWAAVVWFTRGGLAGSADARPVVVNALPGMVDLLGEPSVVLGTPGSLRDPAVSFGTATAVALGELAGVYPEDIVPALCKRAADLKAPSLARSDAARALLVHLKFDYLAGLTELGKAVKPGTKWTRDALFYSVSEYGEREGLSYHGSGFKLLDTRDDSDAKVAVESFWRKVGRGEGARKVDWVSEFFTDRQAAIQHLIPLLNIKDPVKRGAIRRVAEGWMPVEKTAEAIQQLVDDPDPQVREVAARAAIFLRIRREDQVRRLVALLDHSSSSIAAAAARALGQMKPGTSGLESGLWWRHLGNPEREVRLEAIRAIESQGERLNERQVTELTNHLEKESPQQIFEGGEPRPTRSAGGAFEALASALGSALARQPNDVAPVLLRLLADPRSNPLMRQALVALFARSAVRITDSAVIENNVRPLLKHVKPDVRTAAALALRGSISDPGVQRDLFPLLEDGDPQVRSGVVLALSPAREVSEETLSVLIRLLGDESRHINSRLLRVPTRRELERLRPNSDGLMLFTSVSEEASKTLFNIGSRESAAEAVGGKGDASLGKVELALGRSLRDAAVSPRTRALSAGMISSIASTRASAAVNAFGIELRKKIGARLGTGLAEAVDDPAPQFRYPTEVDDYPTPAYPYFHGNMTNAIQWLARNLATQLPAVGRLLGESQWRRSMATEPAAAAARLALAAGIGEREAEELARPLLDCTLQERKAMMLIDSLVGDPAPEVRVSAAAATIAAVQGAEQERRMIRLLHDSDVTVQMEEIDSLREAVVVSQPAAEALVRLADGATADGKTNESMASGVQRTLLKLDTREETREVVDLAVSAVLKSPATQASLRRQLVRHLVHARNDLIRATVEEALKRAFGAGFSFEVSGANEFDQGAVHGLSFVYYVSNAWDPDLSDSVEFLPELNQLLGDPEWVRMTVAAPENAAVRLAQTVGMKKPDAAQTAGELQRLSDYNLAKENLLVDLLDDPDPDVSGRAAESLIVAVHRDDVRRKLHQLLASTHQRLRLAAARALGYSGLDRTQAIAVLLDVLAATDPSQSKEVLSDIQFVARASDPTVLPRLTAYLEVCLKTLGDTAHGRELSYPRERPIWLTAFTALRKLAIESPAQVVASLIQLYGKTDPRTPQADVREEIAAIVSQILAQENAPKDVVQAFWKSASVDESQDVRESARTLRSVMLVADCGKNPQSVNVVDWWVAKLSALAARTDANERAAIVKAIRTWLAIGLPTPRVRHNRDAASAEPEWPPAVVARATQTRMALEKKLSEICQKEDRTWLRIAAWQVLADPAEK
jgi:hypothetical protein